VEEVYPLSSCPLCKKK